MATMRSASPTSNAAVPGRSAVGQQGHRGLGGHAVGQEGVR